MRNDACEGHVQRSGCDTWSVHEQVLDYVIIFYIFHVHVTSEAGYQQILKYHIITDIKT